MSTSTPSAADPPEEIATIRIELVDTDPLIWREVETPTAMTLKGLHDLVQAAVDWDNQHLWELRVGKQRYGRRMPGDDWGGPALIDAARVKLADVLKPRKTVIDYIYDFGDSWEHRLVVTDVRLGQPGVGYPRYVAGERAAPPEDCGGLPGFYATLDALADPKHPDHADAAEWFQDYDPERLNELALKLAVGSLAKRRRAGKARARNPLRP